ncbi:MAG TPA: ABC transporter permease [Burkholderiaceae bacterium]|jgi:putrescine transport system permease protein|nr:ABC transporter permease [Burkholderiaceae bacterium]
MTPTTSAAVPTSRRKWRRPNWWRGRTAVIGIPYAWLLVFFLVPFLIVAKYSVTDIDETAVQAVKLPISVANFVWIATESSYSHALVASLKYALATTVLCLVIGYPFAYFMARVKPSVQTTLLMLVMLPFWTPFLLRVFAWKSLLDKDGSVASALLAVHADRPLLALGLMSEPGDFMNTVFSLLVGMTYTYLPFMILPLYANLAKMDLRLMEAASDLGATPWVVFWRVTVPLSIGGIVAGAMLVFIPCVGEYVMPELLGSPATRMIGQVIFDDNFKNDTAPRAAAVTVILVLLIVVPLAGFNLYRARARKSAQ